MMLHYFIWMFAIIIAAASATNLRLRGALNSNDRRYQEQDTARAFYSYGYSNANAARAEYTIRDGSSRGFYSYVDANGKLQTIQYEAGGSQGFKADATNLPKVPVYDGRPPLPVSNTKEVQQARLNHLKALKEAAQREDAGAVLSTNLKEEKAKQEKDQSTKIEDQDRVEKQEGLSDEDAAILERVRAELTAMLADHQNLREEEQKPHFGERTDKEDIKNNKNRSEDDQKKVDQSFQLMNAQQDILPDEDSRLRTVYTLSDLSSSSYLKLGELEDRLSRLDHVDRDDVRVPISSYYTLVSPTTRYSVTTPTELSTLRPVALSRSLLLSKRN